MRTEEEAFRVEMAVMRTALLVCKSLIRAFQAACYDWKGGPHLAQLKSAAADTGFAIRQADAALAFGAGAKEAAVIKAAVHLLDSVDQICPEQLGPELISIYVDPEAWRQFDNAVADMQESEEVRHE